jgi:hypothetical protein
LGSEGMREPDVGAKRAKHRAKRRGTPKEKRLNAALLGF